jgi:hypothetical protein
MARRKTEQPRCYECGKFLNWDETLFNWDHIQAPWSYDPEAMDVAWCGRCRPFTPPTFDELLESSLVNTKE